ncbi:MULTISPECIES: hypothetical protein [unclassified Roseofilum]|uniref:hypothetical protein n=1 Tax=unclassified Roseofilum TaxID=2620099 RepID=UPI001B2869CB|nr:MULTISPECIES: hypothetical protein [unclassified Roseofilum]MBP0010550.1 hypothetical protein [Roseofilum sp. Belize Diploria]MBP0035067.1 hypothetical protein [Roseofilum sp. Belize BBD 4]
MLELVISSLFFSSLGCQLLMMGNSIHRSYIEIQKRNEEEEEVLTHYEPKEHFGTEGQGNQNGSTKARGWEFKIVRANSDLFRNPTILHQLCREESQAGWILLEKLDDRRVRFRRAIAARQKIRPETLSFDPYRCHYGSSGNSKIWFATLAFLLALMIPAYAGYWVMSQYLNQSPPESAPLPEFLPK